METKLSSIYSMSKSMNSQQRAPGRPLDAGIEAELLRATQDLLIEEGFERLTVDAVAKRCNASKATIYRRWPSKVALAVAATAALLPVPEMPDTGDIREDLVACTRGYVHEDGRIAVLANLLAAARHNPALRIAARDAIGSPISGLFERVLTRAVSRGLIAKGIDIDVISEVFPAIAFHYVAALGLPIDERLAIRIIDSVLLPALRVT
jgi:AcrR family transcriptional regulator